MGFVEHDTSPCSCLIREQRADHCFGLEVASYFHILRNLVIVVCSSSLLQPCVAIITLSIDIVCLSYNYKQASEKKNRNKAMNWSVVCSLV